MKSRLRIPIAFKLVFMTVFMILATVVPISMQNTRMFESTFSKSQDDANAELASSKAIEVEGLFFRYVEKIRLVTELLLQEFSAEEERKRALDLALTRDLDLVNVEIYHLKSGKPEAYRREVNEQHLKSFDLDRGYIDRVHKSHKLSLISLFTGKEKVIVQNVSLSKGLPLLAMAVPFHDETGVVRHVALAHIRLDRLQKAFSLNGARTLYLVDREGILLAHSNDAMALSAKTMNESPIVEEGLSMVGVGNRGQKRFYDPDRREWYVGAYARTGIGPLVIVQAPESIILEPAKILKRSTIEVALYVLWTALFFVFLVSLFLTVPIEKLHEATLVVAKGNFDVRARVHTSDEMSDLADGFNQMVDGLKERDKVKNILNKFHGSSVTEDLLHSDLHLGGSKKNVVVLFSDIRGFTKFSEKHTPEEVVSMLNEYFQIMVSIITTNGGIVDKFVGDAIMAIWGAPKSSGNDCVNAVKAALEMRRALNTLNEKRIKRKVEPIVIGVGLHMGPAISGTIGSTERMEYTVIGDTVNMASRIESSTKAFGADLLISEAVARKVESNFVMDLAGEAEVKGKSDKVKMYKVRGFLGAGGSQSLIKTPYSDFEPETAEKVKVA